MIQSFRSQVDQQFGDTFSRLVGVSGKNNLVELGDLPFYSSLDPRMAVTMGDDPPRSDRVDDSLSVVGIQVRPFGAVDLYEVREYRVLGKGMPDC